MTLQQFYKHFSDISEHFTHPGRTISKSIRLFGVKGTYCPLTAVCRVVRRKTYSLTEWAQAAKDLQLPRELAESIQKAADYDEKEQPAYNADWYSIRKRLIKMIPSTR